MRNVFLVLLSTIILISPVGADEHDRAQECIVELEKLVGTGAASLKTADSNYEKIQLCLGALQEAISDIGAVAETASNDAANANSNAEEVGAFSSRLDALGWGSRGIMEQQQAQAACVGLSGGLSGWVSAVPRKCDAQTVNCAGVCAQVGARAPDVQRQNANVHACFNSLHIYREAISESEGAPGLKTYKYQSCAAAGCGPNYCCCNSL